jgi:hypothetical protein
VAAYYPRRPVTFKDLRDAFSDRGLNQGQSSVSSLRAYRDEDESDFSPAAGSKDDEEHEEEKGLAWMRSGEVGEEGSPLEIDTWDDNEEDRKEWLAGVKARGKGAPKKKRTREESKKFKAKGGKKTAAAE